jgi:orotidine-5'-phosphate decarboxylase
MDKIIGTDKSIIPACDVDIEKFETIVKETYQIPQIGAYKIGALLALVYGFQRIVEIAKKYSNKPLIYDHQKAGTDIPDIGKEFVYMLKKNLMDAIIIFPLSGPLTQASMIQAAKEVSLPVISGGLMTHRNFLVSDGGYIDDLSIELMYLNSSKLGICDFVVPGNKPDMIKRLYKILSNGEMEPIFYAPGFIAQGGVISEAAKNAGPSWHAIVGRAIHESRDIQKTVTELISNL